MQIVAINWHLYTLTHSPYVLAILGASRIIPIIFFSLLSGAIVDAHNRKKILYLTQIAQAILAILLAVITLTSHATPVNILIINMVLVAFYSLDSPARQAFMSRLVPEEHYGNAVSLNVIGYNISTVAGPAIGGLIIGRFGVGAVYLLDALSFIILFASLLGIKASGAIDAAVKRPVSLSAIREGLAFVKHKPLIWSTMLLDFFSTFFGEAAVLMPVFATDVLHGGPELLGLLYAAPFIGATAIGMIASHIGKAIHTGKALAIGVICYGLGTIVFGLSTNVILSLLALTVVGAGDGLSAIIRNIIRQLSTPDHIRGRMTSINMMFYMGGPRLGEMEAGIVAGLIGAPLSVVIGGIGTIIVVAVMTAAIPDLRHYRDTSS
jgi:MFS family permease